MTRTILETVQPVIVIMLEQTRPSSIINEALQSNDEFLYRWGNNPPSMFYEDVTDSRIKSPLRQPQRLEGRGKHLYKYQPIRSKRKGTHALKTFYIRYSVILAILTLASETLWKAPYR